MKKLLVLALVLSMATMANAALTLSVGSASILEGASTTISISGDGSQATGYFFVGIGDGGAALDITNGQVLYTGSAVDLQIMSDDLGIGLPYVYTQLSDVPAVGQQPKPLTGLLVSGIGLTAGNAPGLVVVSLFDQDLTLLDSKSVTITGSTVPEPITVGLLGLGAMFLRRRK